MELNSKTAVITGAANGIGRATALAFANEGMNVVVADIEFENARSVADEIRELGTGAIALQVDVADADSVAQMADVAFNEYGEVNVLFNNAGVGMRKPVHKMRDEDLDWIMGVNLGGVFYGVRAFIERMIEQEGPAWIVNTASEHGISLPAGDLPAYTASKHAVIGLTDSMRVGYADSDIGFSVLCPGWVNTSIWNAVSRRHEKFGGARDLPPETGKIFEERGSDPADVAACVVRGLKNESFYMLSHPEVREHVERRYKELMAAFDAAESDNPKPA